MIWQVSNTATSIVWTANTIICSIDIPWSSGLFKDLLQIEADDGSYSDDDAEPIKDDLFAVVDVEDEIDAPSELWDSPGVKAIVNRLNKVAHINPDKFSTVLQKPISRNSPQPTDARSNPQEVYRFEPGSSDFPMVTMEAMRKEYVNYIWQPILFQQRVHEDFAVCPCSDQPQKIESLTSLYPLTQAGGRCHKCQEHLHKPEAVERAFSTRLNLVCHMWDIF